MALVAARLYRFLHARLSAPNAERNVLLLSLALMLPSLNTGLAADDYLHEIILRGSAVLDGFDRPRLDIFRFCDPKLSPGFLRVGVFTWWDDPNTRLAFFRPISALTHWLDNAAWPDQPWLMHLHCLLWGAVVLLGARTFFRELFTDRFVATLAFALYTLDDARAWFVSWVASRNGVVATAFSVWALVAFRRGRGGSRPASLASLALLALGLLSGEGAIATYGFLFAHALFLEQDAPLRTRLLRLWPYALLLVVWRGVYKALGYGVWGSSLYVDPLGDPLTFALRFLERAPILLFAQVGGSWSDVWTSLFVFPKLRVVLYVAAVLTLLCVGALVRPLWRREPIVRFGVVGALLGLLPASAVFPADRLLTWVALGACPVLAILLAPVLRDGAQLAAPPWLARLAPLAAFVLALNNLVLAPLLIPSRARGNMALRDVLDRSEQGVPKDRSIEDKVLVYVNPPAVPLAAYAPITRAAQGIPRARVQRILATSTTELTVERLDERTLRLSQRGDFLQNPASRLMWSDKRPFSVGEEIPVGELTIVVRRVTDDHKPVVVDARFDHSLEDARYVFRQWLETSYSPFVPPRIGDKVTLPSAEYMRVVFGLALPIEARMD